MSSVSWSTGLRKRDSYFSLPLDLSLLGDGWEVVVVILFRRRCSFGLGWRGVGGEGGSGGGSIGGGGGVGQGGAGAGGGG